VYSKLADTIGRKPVMLAGVGIFVLGSVLCGLAWSMPALIVFRALQGIGAGAVQPLGMTIVGDLYSVAERARVQGYLGLVWAIASVAGPTVGGVFAQFLSWRGIFFVNIPLGALCVWLFVRHFHEKFDRRRHRIDYAGAILLASALALLLLGILEGGVSWAWWSPPSVGVFTGGVLLLTAFLFAERRASEPVLPLWVFSRRLLLTTSIGALGAGVVMFGLTSFVPTYLQGALGVAPLVAGLTLAVFTIGWPIASAIAGRVYLRIGFRRTMLIGGTIVAVSVGGIAAVSPTPDLVLIGLFCFTTGFGMGWLVPVGVIAAQASVEWGERAVVTGTNLFMRSIGSAVGVAVLGSIANAVIAGRGGDVSDPSTVIAAYVPVFTVVAVVAAATMLSVLLVPRTPPARPFVAPGSDAPMTL